MPLGPCQPRLHAKEAITRTQRTNCTMSWPKAAQWPSHGSRAQHCHRSRHGAVTCCGNTTGQLESCAIGWCSVGMPFPHANNSHSRRSWGLCDVVGNQTSLCKRNQTNTCEVTCSLVFAFPFLSQANGSMLKLLNHCTREIHPASFNEVIWWSPDHLRPEWLRGSPSHLQTSSRNPPIRAPHSKPHGQCPMLRYRSLNSEERST